MFPYFLFFFFSLVAEIFFFSVWNRLTNLSLNLNILYRRKYSSWASFCFENYQFRTIMGCLILVTAIKLDSKKEKFDVFNREEEIRRYPLEGSCSNTIYSVYCGRIEKRAVRSCFSKYTMICFVDSPWEAKSKGNIIMILKVFLMHRSHLALLLNV